VKILSFVQQADLEFAARLGLAVLCGASIGFERQWRARMAGLRTNALVAAGAALFVLLSAGLEDPSPSRVAAQVVSGIGFLGAGVILRDGLNIRGLNTAATLWCAAAVGCLAGAGMPLGAITGAAAVIVTNVALRPLARRLDRSPDTGAEFEHPYRFVAVCRSENEAHVRTLVVRALAGPDFGLRSVRSDNLPDGESVEVRADLCIAGGRGSTALENAVSRLSLEPAVTSVAWELIGDGIDDGDHDDSRAAHRPTWFRGRGGG